MMVMNHEGTMSLVPTSKLRQAADAIRTAADLLRAGEDAANLQTVQCDAAERATYALALLLELLVLDVPGAPVVPTTIIGPVVPEGGETRRQYLLEHGLVPRVQSVDEMTLLPSTADVDYERARAERAAALTPRVVVDPALPAGAAVLVDDRGGFHTLGFVPFEGGGGLSIAEQEAVRRAVAADPLVIDEVEVDGLAELMTTPTVLDAPEPGDPLRAQTPPGGRADLDGPAPGDGASPDERPWPCLFCDRDDWSSWQRLNGHMRGAHQQSPLKTDYLGQIEERRKLSASA